MISENENESEVSEKEEKDLIPGYKTLEDFTKVIVSILKLLMWE